MEWSHRSFMAFNVDGKQIGLPAGVYPSFLYLQQEPLRRGGLA